MRFFVRKIGYLIYKVKEYGSKLAHLETADRQQTESARWTTRAMNYHMPYTDKLHSLPSVHDMILKLVVIDSDTERT